IIDIELSESLQEQLIQIRRHLHQYPELSFEEHGTCEFIVSTLERWGIPYRRIGETGVIVDIVGEKGEGLHVGLRADIDALPIEEKTELPFSSTLFLSEFFSMNMDIGIALACRIHYR